MDDHLIRAKVDRRVPPLVLIPQLAAPLTFAGDPATARITFLLTVIGNIPIALAGRAIDMDALVAEPSRTNFVLEWTRTGAAWAYGLLLLSLLPYLHGSLQAAMLIAAAANGIAGALMYVAPGASTPAGAHLRHRRDTGVAWRHETVVFTATRSARLLVAATVALLFAGQLLASLACLWLSATATLLAHTLRPRNAALPDIAIRDPETTR